MISRDKLLKILAEMDRARAIILEALRCDGEGEPVEGRIEHFLKHKCKITPGAYISTRNLFDAFIAWDSSNDFQGSSIHKFSKTVQSLIVSNDLAVKWEKASGGNIWKNIELT